MFFCFVIMFCSNKPHLFSACQVFASETLSENDRLLRYQELARGLKIREGFEIRLAVLEWTRLEKLQKIKPKLHSSCGFIDGMITPPESPNNTSKAERVREDQEPQQGIGQEEQKGANHEIENAKTMETEEMEQQDIEKAKTMETEEMEQQDIENAKTMETQEMEKQDVEKAKTMETQEMEKQDVEKA